MDKIVDIRTIPNIANPENFSFNSSPDEEDEFDFIMQARYKVSSLMSENKVMSSIGSEEESDPIVSSIKKRKNKLGPPMRMARPTGDAKKPVTSRPITAQEKPAIAQARPTTAQVKPPATRIKPPRKMMPKKNDPVALFQQRQSDWKSSPFLNSGSNSKEGRKLRVFARPQTGIKLSKGTPRTEFATPYEKTKSSTKLEDK